MKFYALIAAMLLSGSIAFAHTDPIVMIINGQSVKKSEFEYFYQKNHLGNTVDSKSVKVFADGFVDYKLKVQAAKDAHLDTLPNIRRVLKRYHDTEACESMPDKGSVHVAHILLRLGQKASYQEQEIVKNRIDSIYQALCKGADFADLAKKYSDDKGYCRCISCGKVFPWKEIQCGHYMSRRYMSTRFSEDNCRPQCVACNIFNQGNIQMYRRALIKQIGEQRVDLIEVRARTENKNWSLFEYNQLIAFYQKEVDKLLEQKHL